MMKLAVLVDYDNLLDNQKKSGILDVIKKVLTKFSDIYGLFYGVRAECIVRLYGGWYEGNIMTQIGQEVSVQIQKDFPEIIKVDNKSGGICSISTVAELAVSMLEEPAHHLFNTFRKRGRPQNVRVANKDDIGCSSSDCMLESVKKMLRTGKCNINSCSFPDMSVVYRAEQKIVDTMLTCDLIFLENKEYDFLFLVSADDDFLPPIRTMILRDQEVIRVHPKFSANRNLVEVAGKNLKEMEVF